MGKELLKNSWVLAGLLFSISMLLGLILFLVTEFFDFSPGIFGISGIVGAMLVGQIYSMNFKEIMPKKLKINVTIIYILAQIAISSLCMLILNTQDYLLFFGILIGASLFYSFFIYLMLGLGGKIYAKK